MGRIIGDRIVLREFRSEDLSGMRSWITDERTTKHLSGTFLKPQTWEQTENYLRSLLNGDAGGANLVIAEKETLKYMGQTNLFMVDNTARKAELAIVLKEDCAGRGYGYEALRLLLAFAFDQMNLHRVYLKVHSDNERAIALYEKLGFRHEGRLRDELYRDGKYMDVICMGILKGEFRGV